jgi:hypothetical protein
MRRKEEREWRKHSMMNKLLCGNKINQIMKKRREDSMIRLKRSIRIMKCF